MAFGKLGVNRGVGGGRGNTYFICNRLYCNPRSFFSPATKEELEEVFQRKNLGDAGGHYTLVGDDGF